MTRVRRWRPWGLLSVLLAACSVAGPGAVPMDGVLRDARFDNDRLPPMAATPAEMPFVTAARAMLPMTEAVTQGGSEPLAFGRIEVPKGWTANAPAAPDGPPCDGRKPCIPYYEPGTPGCASWTSCVLWQAVAPTSGARIALGSPSRIAGQHAAPGGQGSAAARIARDTLRAFAERGGTFEIVATSEPLNGRTPASRRGWSTGAAWLAIARDGPLGATREFLAIDVEVKATGRGFHDVQTSPLLLIVAPSEQFDLAAAQAVWQSMHVDSDWIPRWWLAWELRTVRATCEGGYRRGECRREPEMGISYFQSGHSLGLWDLHVAEPYVEPEPQRYDR